MKSTLETSLSGPRTHVLFVIEAVSGREHPVGVQQAASAGMVPAAVMGREDL